MGGPRAKRTAAVASIVLVAIASVAACGDIEDQSLCSVYADHLDDRAAIEALDAETLSAGEAAEIAEDYLETVRHLQEVADTRFTDQLTTLEMEVRDVLLTLESVQEDEDYSTWAPLVEDSLEEAADAAVTVEDLFAPQCPNAGDES